LSIARIEAVTVPAMSWVEQRFCRSASWRKFTRRVVLPWALQGLAPRGRLLEIGSGNGAMAVETARAFPGLEVIATDVDPGMVSEARERLRGDPRVSIRLADVTSLDVETGTVDFVASHLMLNHVVEWEAAIGEIARVLRPGGVLFGYDLTPTAAARLVHVLDRSPYRLIAPEQLEGALRLAGFGEVTVTSGLRGAVMRFTAWTPA